ncbi:MAG TPA: extracellular solute-binding protein [Nitrososphaerales archaeon]|nr:extracellular solute-binding protein [Nitrososphaerales archaeon]
MRYGMGLAGAGLVSLGLADLASPNIFGGGPHSSSSSSSSSFSSATTTASSSQSSTQYSTIPDYQDFLSWLHSVSGPYTGKSLDISLEAEFGPFSTQLIDNDFLNAAGIRDNYDIKPYALQLDAVSLMSSTQSTAYDCYSLDVENLGVFPTLPISPYTLMEKYPDLTYPGLNLDDYHRYSWDRIATYPPDLSGGNGGSSASTVTVLPFDTPTLVLFYRKDIFNELGLTPPATWDDHFANCTAIQKSGKVPFGSVSMASPTVAIIYEYQAHLASFGGSLWAVDGNNITPTFTTDACVAALEDYIRFYPLSDPASLTYTWDNVFSSLAYESAACGFLFDGYAQWLEDPGRGNVTGLMSYAFNPKGPSGRFHPYAGSGVGVSKYSKNPEMAWLWVQWATAKGTQEAKLLGKYNNFPTRTSVTQAPNIETELQSGALGVASLVNEVWNEGSLTTLLGFPKWLQAAVIIEGDLSAAFHGSLTAAAALADAQTRVEKIGALTFSPQ